MVPVPANQTGCRNRIHTRMGRGTVPVPVIRAGRGNRVRTGTVPVPASQTGRRNRVRTGTVPVPASQTGRRNRICTGIRRGTVPVPASQTGRGNRVRTGIGRGMVPVPANQTGCRNRIHTRMGRGTVPVSYASKRTAPRGGIRILATERLHPSETTARRIFCFQPLLKLRMQARGSLTPRVAKQPPAPAPIPPRDALSLAPGRESGLRGLPARCRHGTASAPCPIRRVGLCSSPAAGSRSHPSWDRSGTVSACR